MNALIPSFISPRKYQQHKKIIHSAEVQSKNGNMKKNQHISSINCSENEKVKLVPMSNVMASICSAVLIFSSAAVANAETDPFVFNGYYNDPLHPMCERHIKVSNDGTKFHFSGTASGTDDDVVGRGCTRAEIKEFGIRVGEFDGTVTDANTISVSGKDLEGVWEKRSNLEDDLDGIRWSNGNKWTKIEVRTPVAAPSDMYIAGIEGFYGI